MIRVWDKKVYDTTKAEEIAFYDAPIPVNDYNWYTETLYRTKKGNWFLAGRGGPMSQWNESDGFGEMTGSYGIRPLERGDALNWLQSHEMPDHIIQYFGDDLEEA